jgi:hypothetical protein
LIHLPWEPQGILVADPATRVRAKWLTSLVKLPLLVAFCGIIYLLLARFLGVGDASSVPLVGRFFRKPRA